MGNSSPVPPAGSSAQSLGAAPRQQEQLVVSMDGCGGEPQAPAAPTTKGEQPNFSSCPTPTPSPGCDPNVPGSCNPTCPEIARSQAVEPCNPSGGGGGGSPKPTIAPCAVLPGGANGGDKPGVGKQGQSLNQLLAGSVVTQNLAIALSNQGDSFSLIVNSSTMAGTSTNPNPATELYDPANPTATTVGSNPGQNITFNEQDMAAAEQLGEDPTQVAFEELDHIWYADNSMSSTSQFANTATGTMGGVAYTWTIVNSQGAFNPNAYLGYQHFLIHNDLVAGFGSDQTNSLAEALQQSDQQVSSSSAHQIASANVSVIGSTSNPPKSAPPNAKCGDPKTTYQLYLSSGPQPLPPVKRILPMMIPWGTINEYWNL
jgi:hypothetical protein